MGKRTKAKSKPRWSSLAMVPHSPRARQPVTFLLSISSFRAIGPTDEPTFGTLTTPTTRAIFKHVVCWGERRTVVCDGRCDKAWGINDRPHTRLSDDPDDIVYLPDSALGHPGAPSTFEGGDGRPADAAQQTGQRMNRWCVRQCERSVVVGPTEDIVLPDLEHPRPNKPARSSNA